jgi:hypothetical protein
MLTAGVKWLHNYVARNKYNQWINEEDINTMKNINNNEKFD